LGPSCIAGFFLPQVIDEYGVILIAGSFGTQRFSVDHRTLDRRKTEGKGHFAAAKRCAMRAYGAILAPFFGEN
jgi:hypothetical protein